MYNYKKSKETIESILKSPTKIVEKDFVPSSDSAFTYENGITACVSALFGVFRRGNKPPVLPGEGKERSDNKSGELDASRKEVGKN